MACGSLADDGCSAIRSWPRWSSTALLDDLVRTAQHRLRDRQAKGLRRLEVDDQLELGGLLDWQISGLGSSQDLGHVISRPSVKIEEIWAIGHEMTTRCAVVTLWLSTSSH